jgi:hypothetical protein
LGLPISSVIHNEIVPVFGEMDWQFARIKARHSRIKIISNLREHDVRHRTRRLPL